MILNTESPLCPKAHTVVILAGNKHITNINVVPESSKHQVSHSTKDIKPKTSEMCVGIQLQMG